jgi:hypothetical protein
MKDKYLKLIEKAGFAKVKVIEETHFPVKLMLNDPTAKALLKKTNTSKESLKDVTYSVVSVKVSATKPRK